VVGELPYSEKASEGQGKCSPKSYSVVIGLGEVAKKAKNMRPGKRGSSPGLRFIMVSFDLLDGSFYPCVGEGGSVDSEVKLVGFDTGKILLKGFYLDSSG